MVVLMNAVADVPRISREIERVVLPRYAEARRRAEPSPPSAAAGARFDPPAGLAGEWSGTLRTWERTVPMKLVVLADGDVHVTLGDGLETVLNRVQWQENELVGRFAGTIPTVDAARWPHDVLVSLRLRGGTLSGTAAAMTTTERVYFALSSYVALTRKVADK